MSRNRIDWEQYAAKDDAPKTDWEQYRAPASNGFDINNLPWFARMALGLGQSSAQPLRQAVPQRVAATGRGFMDLGEGVKQLGLDAGEGMGFVPQGTATDYTKQRQAERDFYDRTPAGRDPLSQGLREGASQLPMMAAGLGPWGMEGGLLRKMLMGGMGGGAAGATEFVKPGEDRGQNIIKSAAVGAGAAAVPELADQIDALGSNMKNLFTKVNPKDMAYAVQRGHDTMMNDSTKIYEHLKKEAKADPILNDIKLPESILEEARTNLPKTRGTDLLIENARKGTYEGVHALQSDLGKAGSLSKAGSYADINIGKEMMDTREKINEIMSNHFKSLGRDDLHELLGEARNIYRDMHKLYYDHNGVANLVHPDTRFVPKDPQEFFSEESKPMQKIMDAHPEVKRTMDVLAQKKKVGKALKNFSKLAPKLGIVGYGGVKGYNYLSADND